MYLPEVMQEFEDQLLGGHNWKLEQYVLFHLSALVIHTTENFERDPSSALLPGVTNTYLPRFVLISYFFQRWACLIHAWRNIRNIRNIKKKLKEQTP